MSGRVVVDLAVCPRFVVEHCRLLFDCLVSALPHPVLVQMELVQLHPRCVSSPSEARHPMLELRSGLTKALETVGWRTKGMAVGWEQSPSVRCEEALVVVAGRDFLLHVGILAA